MKAYVIFIKFRPIILLQLVKFSRVGETGEAWFSLGHALFWVKAVCVTSTSHAAVLFWKLSFAVSSL